MDYLLMFRDTSGEIRLFDAEALADVSEHILSYASIYTIQGENMMFLGKLRVIVDAS